MKIEKLNDQQIRCTLTREDLAIRHIKLSELAYGTEKTRALFQDMMDQAFTDFGFEVEDIPLMVEAIPMSAEQIVLIITKVEAPDELDTRFSEFSQYCEPEEELPAEGSEGSQAALDLPEELLKLLRQIKQELTEAGESETVAEQTKQEEAVALFSFSELDAALPAAQTIAPLFSGDSTLYRDETTGTYLLFLHPGSHSPMEFNRICHTMAAYLQKKSCTPATESYWKEHGKRILASDAVQTLAQL